MHKQSMIADHSMACSHVLALACAALVSGQTQSSGADKVWPERLRGLCIGKPRAAVAAEQVFQRMADWACPRAIRP